ncbi:MAG: TonB-dependent receptor plug domain-containing protein, partial [Opitutaceae bacterium]
SAPASAAESNTKRSFDIPSGPAASTFKQFIAQSRVQVMFLAGDVASVRTKALKGDFTPREAIERLLEGTPLTAVQTPNGSIAIKGTAIPNGVRAAQTANDRPVANPRIEAAPGSTALPPGEKDAIVLSPFEVTSDKDTGFAAAASLAGGRLAGELRDTPVAYSVITREFIDAVGITNLQEAADWSTGNVIALEQIGGGNFFGNFYAYNTRGFSSIGTRPQRNFFPQYINSDSYNLERYDFGRGPNSILFGNGTLGGVVSSTTKRAKTERAAKTVEASVGSWRNYRAVIDVNQPFMDNKAAVRTVALWGDSDGWRMKDFDKREGVFLTGTLKPFKNTEIRVEGEYFVNARQVGFFGINDLFSGWDGTTTFNSVAPLATLPANANAVGISRRAANYYVYDPFGSANAIMSYQNDPITRSGGSTSTTPIGGFTQGGAASFGVANAPILWQPNLPAGRFDNAIGNSFFRPFSEEFTMSPDAPITTIRFKDVQFTVSHRIGDRFHFEVAGDVNRTQLDNNGEQNRGTTDVYIDINQVLPNGAPNPNFRQPYADGIYTRNNFTFTQAG